MWPVCMYGKRVMGFQRAIIFFIFIDFLSDHSQLSF